MKLRHNAPAHLSPALTRGDDLPRPACADNPIPFDLVLDYTSGPTHRAALAECQAICASCPMRDLCTEMFADHPGVIAGQTKMQRTMRAKRPAAKCGTSGGYMRHKRVGEEPCLPCALGHAERLRINREKRKAQRAAQKAAA